MAKISVVTPAYNEAANLPLLRERLLAVLEASGLEWEWIIVDDHSRDDTYALIQAYASADPRIIGLRLARNHGSHAALLGGFRYARGDCGVLLTADLQDPPEGIPLLLDHWRQGADVVWSTRELGRQDPPMTLLLARLYYWVMQRLLHLDEVPATGGDLVLMDRKVLDALAACDEPHPNALVLISSLGFRQVSVPGRREQRRHGQSAFTFARKMKLFVDTVTAFSARPLRWISQLGAALALAGLVQGGWLLAAQVRGGEVGGVAPVLALLLLLGGMQMVAIGVVGEYLWRTLEQSRRRPLWLVEAQTTDRAANGVVAPVKERGEGR